MGWSKGRWYYNWYKRWRIHFYFSFNTLTLLMRNSDFPHIEPALPQLSKRYPHRTDLVNITPGNAYGSKGCKEENHSLWGNQILGDTWVCLEAIVCPFSDTWGCLECVILISVSGFNVVSKRDGPNTYSQRTLTLSLHCENVIFNDIAIKRFSPEHLNRASDLCDHLGEFN